MQTQFHGVRSMLKEKGSVLLEAIVAILIFSLGVLGVAGLQAHSIKDSSDAKYRADAAFLANQLVSQMMVDQTNIASYAGEDGDGPTTKQKWFTNVRELLPNAGATVTVENQPCTAAVSITVGWCSPEEKEKHGGCKVNDDGVIYLHQHSITNRIMTSTICE